MDEIISLYQSHRAISLSVAFIVTAIVLSWLRRDRRLDSIPCPQGYPIIGLGYQLPPKAPALFRKWGNEYGELFKLRVGWYNWVVINSPEAVKQILEKQSITTSSKAPSPMGHDIVTGGLRMLTMRYGPQWRTFRAMMRGMSTVPMVATFMPSQEFETKQLLFDLATDNKDQRMFYQHMRRFVFSIVLTNTFGTRVNVPNHPDVQNAIKSQGILRATSRPGAFLVDEIPPLAKLPNWLQPGLKRAQEAKKVVFGVKMDLWHRFEKQIAAGKASHSFAREIYEKRDYWYSQGLTDEDLAWVAGGFVEAGFESTSATLNGLVLYLAENRRVQDTAQEELMRVVGQNRLPNFEDMPNLPYIRACVKEILRINPFFAPGIRHYADEDIVYKDYVIPKGTVLVANTAFLHYDPSRFEDPYEFKPERYLNHPLYSSEYMTMGDPYKRDHFAFSTGRRTCPGARLAENSLNIALASILWAFEIRPPLVNGVEAKMDLSDDAFTDGGPTLPKPFAARFVPRDEGRLKVVKEQWDVAKREGYELRGAPVDLDGMVGL